MALGSVEYDHSGPTVLVSDENVGDDGAGGEMVNPRVWIEGESDDERCPVRDGTPLTSPLANGSLLADLVDATKGTFFEEDGKKNNGSASTTNIGGGLLSYAGNLGDVAAKVTGRLQSLTPTDLASVLGIDKKFAEREAKIIQSIASGEGLADHMEDKYYSSMGRATGFIAVAGEPLQEF
uniref:Uncharacterized protein n=1 Tax=Cyclophora tenuis TaxID=216820 RepID=A0A7S1DDK3_CYCTE